MRMTALFLVLALAGCGSESTSTPSENDAATADTGAATDTGTATDSGSATDTGGTTTDTGGTTGTEVTVQVGNWFYKPKDVTIKVGDTVKWVFANGTHSVTSGTSCTGDGKFDSKNHSSPYTYTRKFTEAGSFPYFCDYMDHCTSRGQVGSVTVMP